MHSKQYKIVIVLLIGVFGGLISCDRTIHEYPDAVKSDVIIRPYVDRSSPSAYKEVVYDEKWRKTERLLDPLPAASYTPDKGHSMRLILDIYKCGYQKTTSSMRHGELIERRVLELDRGALPPQDTIHTSLYDGDYCILAWADYVRKNEVKDTYYDAGSLQNIHAGTTRYPSDMHLRSSATGRQYFILSLDLGPEGYPILPDLGKQSSRIIPVMMSRPSGRYKIIASDYEAFVKDGGNLNGATVKVVYKQYVSIGYDVSLQEPNEFISTYHFEVAPLREETDIRGESVLVGDYIFVGTDKEDNIIADFYFFDADGFEINRCSNIEIPLKRNHETIVKGPFLTRKVDNGGQVSIDENFEGEHIIKI